MTGRPRVCILGWGGVPCPMSAAWYTLVWQHIGQTCIATSRDSCLKVTFYPNKQNTRSGLPVAIEYDWDMLGRALAKVEPHRTKREKLLTKLQIQ